MNKTIYVMALRSELPTSSLDGCDIHTKLNQRNTPNLRNASSVPALESSNNEGWTLLGASTWNSSESPRGPLQ